LVGFWAHAERPAAEEEEGGVVKESGGYF